MTSKRLAFPNAEGEELAGRLELPAGAPRAYALFAHCFTCSKDVAAATRVSRALCRRGIAVLRFDFTGLGNSDGDFANTNFSSNVRDLSAAAAHMRAELEAPAVLIGHSLGGAAVLQAAADLPEVRAVVTINAPADPAHVRALLKDDLDEIRRSGRARVELAGREFTIERQFLDDLEAQDLPSRVAELGRALLVLHAPEDEIVGIENARRIHEAARHPKSFVALDGADHLLSRPEDSEYVGGVVAAWLERYLPAAREAGGDDAPREGVVRVVSTGSGYAQDVLAGRHRLRADEPESAGGDDTGPNPYDLLLAALGACTAMTLQMYARRKEWRLDSVAVELSHERVHAADCATCDDDGGKVDRIRRHIGVRGQLDSAQRARLLEIANRCPVHRTLVGQKEIPTLLAQLHDAAPGEEAP